MEKRFLLPGWLVLLPGILIAGALYFFSTGLDGFRPLVWVAPVPVLVLAFRLPARSAAVVAFTAYLLGGLNLLSYLTDLVPITVVIATFVIPATAFTLAVWVARYTVLRLEHWATVAVFPAVWTSYEYLLSILSPHGTAGSLAYTQTDFLPLIQIVSVTGLWGITFLLTLFPSAVAIAWHFRRNRRRAGLALAIPLVTGLLVLGYGWVRLAQPTPGESIRVGLAATDSTIRYFDTEQAEEALAVVRAYAGRVHELAVRGAQVVVLPEKFVGVTQDYAGEVFRILGEAAHDNGVTVIAGLNFIGPDYNRNTAAVFSPDGRLLAQFEKAHLIPGFESDYRPGAGLTEFSLFESTAGVAICKDMDFPNWASQYAGVNTGILFVPAWDFVVDGRLHSRMALMRGVENGYAVVRPAQEGQVMVSDHLGRVLAEAATSDSPEVLLVSAVQPGPGGTFYTLAGDWFPRLNVLFLLLVLAATVVWRRDPDRSRGLNG